MKYKELYENVIKRNNINEINNENNKNEISKSNINDKAIIDYTQNENEEKDDNINNNDNIININIKKDLEEDSNSIDKSQNEEKDIIINNYKNEIEKLKEEINKIKNEMENEIKEYKSQLNEEKSMNFVLQNKIKELNMKSQLKKIEEMSKNGRININNNINNININFKNKNKFNSEKKQIRTENNEKDNITPKNYEIIKQYQLNSELKWYLFKKKCEKNNNSDNESSYTNGSFSNYIWFPVKDENDFEEFDLPEEQKFEKIKDLEIKFKNLEKKYRNMEKEYNLLNANYSKLKYGNKNEKILIENINRLKSENKNLNKIISSYSNKNNFIGLSFIEENNNINDLDDKCLEEILDELDKNNDNNKIKNITNKIYYKTSNKFYKKEDSSFQNLKTSIDSLLSQIEYSQIAKGMLANILKQFGCSEEDIHKLIGNYRGVISIPIKNLNFLKK